MSLKLITPPATEPISLDEARAQCRVDSNAEDALIAIYIQAARQHAEGLLHSALISQVWEQAVDQFPESDGIQLGKPPVLSINSVTYVDTAGATQVMASNSYVLDAPVQPGWLMPADGTTWPATDNVVNAVRVQFTSGFGSAGSDVPAPIRAWMLLTIAYLYAQREREDATGKVIAIPGRFVDGLLDPWRQYAL